MTDRSILYRLRAALQGGYVAVAQEVELLASYIGVLNGARDTETALRRVDGTGIGAAFTTYSGTFSATASNIDTWFGGRQLVRLRCVGRGSFGPGALAFDLPGTTALNQAFDQLQTLGVAERLEFVIEYTGTSDSFVSIRPRVAPSPQITGATNIIVRQGVAARLEITRTGGIISDYLWIAISQIGTATGLVDGALTLIRPSVAVWDASDGGPLPTTGVARGNAYKVVNAPSDDSGRFGEVMRNDDWVVWTGDTFTSWSATPLQWFVISAHDVRRITALEQDFLQDISVSARSSRNEVIRGEDYAISAGEIRIKMYALPSDYSAADLNTTGDIDAYVNPTDVFGRIGVRLQGTQATLLNVLPTLYIFAENTSASGGTFTRVLNLQDDFTHQGDFGVESDYLSDENYQYTANDTLRVYLGTLIDRYNSPNLDIIEENLSDDVQFKLNDRQPGQGLPPALAELNNQANVFNFTHGEFRSNSNNIYLTNTAAFLKNLPDTFPNTASTFANEINGSLITTGDPTPVTAIQDVSTLTNNVMTGAGISGVDFPITTQDENNWHLIIGGWLYYDSIPTSFETILSAEERNSGAQRPIFGMGPNGLTFRQRATTGSTINTGIRHPIYSTDGQILQSFVVGDLTHTYRIYRAQTWFIQVSGYSGGVLQGGQGKDYVVTNINTDQAATTVGFNVGPGNQDVQISFTSNATLYGGSAHVITITAASLIGGIDELRVSVLDTTFTVPTSTGNTYDDVTLDTGHVAAGRLMRYIASFRSINGVPDGNQEVVISFFGYDDNGNPRIFDENTIQLSYPALDLRWNNMRYGGGSGVHQNVQLAFLNPDTPLSEFPRHSTLNNWETNYSNKATDWVWRNVHGPSQDTEAVYFPEFVNFPNQILRDEGDGKSYRLVVQAGVLGIQEIV